MKVAIVLNSNAGTLRGLDPARAADDVAAVFRARGHQATAEAHAGRDAIAAVERICRQKSCDAVIVGGGDGTISAASAAIAENGLVLGVLPLGTMNLFARSLKTPFGMKAAAEALAAGKPIRVDIGEVNGRPFIHHVTLGMHPRIVRLRDKLSYSSPIGKLRAGVVAWWTVLRQPPSLDVRIRADRDRIERRTSVVIISNNPLGEGHLPYADDLRQGKLALYVTTSRRWHDLLELAARMTLGEFSANPLLESWQAERIDIGLGRERVKASVDGEILALATPLRLRVRKGGLQVLQPSRPAGRLAV